MTIVYDPLTYRTIVARPGEIPYKFWSVNKYVIDAAAAGVCTLHSGDDAPADTAKLWLDLTIPENAAGSVKAYNGAEWTALTPQLFYSHIAGGTGGFVTDAEMTSYVSSQIGSALQAYDADLGVWATLTPSVNAQSLVTAADYAAMRALLDLEAGTDFLTPAAIAAGYQQLNGNLTAIAALSTTSYGRAFLALADAAAGRTALALGTLATQSGTFSGTSSGTNTGDQTITLTGDVTGSGSGAFTATLTTVNSNVGSFGIAGSVAQFVVNAKGLITSAVNVAISIASTAINDATSAGRSMLTAANAAAQTALLSAFVGDSGAGGTKGLVPAPAAGDATKFLKGDGTFSAIPGGGDALTSNPLSQFAATTSAQLRAVLSDEIGTGAAVFESAIREKLTAARTYYVRTDGSDSNTGLANTSGGAFLTVAKALSICAALDAATYDVTVSVGAGTFAETVTLPPMVGSGTFTLSGAGTASTTINNVIVSHHAAWSIGSFKMTGGTTLLTVGPFARLTVSAAVDFGASSADQVFCQQASQFYALANYTISGGSARHWRCDESSSVFAYGRTVTLSGTPAFSGDFAYFFHGSTAVVGGMTFSGSATGRRFTVSSNSVINTGGGGASYLPGNSVGTTDTATGGIYV